ncbi:hypothetical protein CN526_23030 [Bacillus wiedmannii]|uniref:hypothetical protein n=1 Tax=Bacillus wiedmannii TaxID=1890302 RepID=UPI000BF5A0A4|nr:hypothetical protein [Bacillus wiedmannii]PEU23141.1 hypothetical protein CN526_23030 [Bacillus wiedmannii]
MCKKMIDSDILAEILEYFKDVNKKIVEEEYSGMHRSHTESFIDLEKELEDVLQQDGLQLEITEQLLIKLIKHSAECLTIISCNTINIINFCRENSFCSKELVDEADFLKAGTFIQSNLTDILY